MGLFDDIYDMFGGGGDKSNPADAAMPYYDRIPDILKQYYNPYIQRGDSAWNIFNPIQQSMANDPTAYLNNIMKGYKPSQGYQYQLDQMQKAAGNSAAAGGMRGSQQDIQNAAHIADQLSGADMQNFLSNVLGIQDKGMTGLEDQYGTGFKASGSLADQLANVLGTQGSLAFQGQANQNQDKSDFLSSLFKLGGAGLGAFMGGPWGAAAGGALGGSLGGGRDHSMGNVENNIYSGWF